MKIFFSGIGGIGMSALAQISTLLNNQTIGSDLKKTYITEKLEKMGIKIFYNQSSQNITQDLNLFVYSSAITPDNPEFIKAKQLKIPLLHRSEYLNEILKNKQVISITGSSGKTTTTTITGIALNKLEIKSNLITGGWIKEIDSNIIWNNSDMVVLEADESDGSLTNYPSHIGLITDLAVDINLNSQKFKNTNNPQNKLKDIYTEFVKKIKLNNGKLIISNDTELINFIKENDFKPDIIFGESKPNVFSDVFISLDLPYISFQNLAQTERNGYPLINFTLKINIKEKEEEIGRVQLKTIGTYNALNFIATASIIFSITENIQTLKKLCLISESIPFAKRRFEILFNEVIKNKRLIIVDDYAHNPKKIKSLLSNLNKVYKNYQRIVIFQPHRYTRTMMFWENLITVFKGMDYLIILPIYEAGENPIPGISSENLTLNIKKQAEKEENIFYIETFEQTQKLLEKLINNKDSIVVFVGAGNITNLANTFAQNFLESTNFVKKI
ncbi:MAG: Mur ligase domain-containing protein [bacterium]